LTPVENPKENRDIKALFYLIYHNEDVSIPVKRFE
jgi:hypothetical protein